MFGRAVIQFLSFTIVLSLGAAHAAPAAGRGAEAAIVEFSCKVEKDASTGWDIVVLEHHGPRDVRATLRARIAPAAGGNLFSFTYGGQELLLQPATLKDLLQQRTGMPVLFPTPNRVRDARMTFEGQTFQFQANNQNNFIHGLARRHPWKAEPPTADKDGASVTLVLDWNDSQPEFARFPIRHRLSVTYRLQPGGMRVSYRVENQDKRRLPYGFGLHPYFRLPGARRDVRITVPLTRRMQAVDMLPTGTLLPVAGTPHDLRAGRTLDTLDIDDVYFGMTPAQRAGFHLREGDVALTLSASAEFTHLVAFTPWDRPLFALENQTSSTDAHNLWEKGIRKESNLQILEPGGSGGGFVEWKLERRPFLIGAARAAGARTHAAHVHYDQSAAPHLVPLLSEVVRFPTVAGNDQARLAQQAWLKRTGTGMGFAVKEAGLVTEIDLPGPAGAPVLGLLVHGDVQPVEAARWSIPPFEGKVRDGELLGRGSADDKGPLVQALLAMKALRDSGVARTHTVRLLVGSDEESSNKDIAEYLKTHAPPAYSLVLDSAFPVVVGEKAWDALYLTTPLGSRAVKGSAGALPYEVVSLQAGQTPSIVPDEARLVLAWKAPAGGAPPDWAALVKKLNARPPGTDLRLEAQPAGDRLTVVVRGRAAHGGVNLEGGRNALVGLARAMEGLLPAGGADDLLAAARTAGRDLHGAGLGLGERHPLWGRHDVNVATLQPVDGGHRLVINVRRPPPRTAAQVKEKLLAWTAAFNARTGASLQADGYFKDEPLVFDPGSKLVRRLLDIYARETGKRERPAISGGGTYAKRMPNSIAFGMWFPGKPYPGHDVDERNPIIDLHRGAHVLIGALVELATTPPLVKPFQP